MTSTSITEPGRIVVVVDGSASSRAALRWAGHWAISTGATLVAVSAWQWPATYGWSYPSGVHRRPFEEAEQLLEGTVQSVLGSDRPAGMELAAEEGGAARVLLDYSRGADLLVVGSRGHGGFVGLLLGSVSTACAEHATCPVLVMHGSDEDQS